MTCAAAITVYQPQAVASPAGTSTCNMWVLLDKLAGCWLLLQKFNNWIDKCIAASPQPGICLFPEGKHGSHQEVIAH